MDKGYTDSRVLVDSRKDYGITITGPVADDPSWQARSEEGLDKSRFVVDWDQQVVTCPAGNRSISWLPNTYPQNVTVHVPPGRMQPIDSPMIFKGLAWRGGLPSDSVCDSLGTWNPKTNLT